MNCLDCLDSEQLAAPAVAVCSGCGAAVCPAHLVRTERRLLRTGAMGRQDPVDPPTRTLRCQLCSAAADGIDRLVAEPLRLPWARARGASHSASHSAGRNADGSQR